MSSVLTYISDLEKELSLLDNILQNIFIYDMEQNKLAVNLRFHISRDYDENLIGGLSATINDFAGKTATRSVRSIVLEKLKLLFLSENGFLIIFAVSPSYPESQFTKAMHAFADSFSACFDNPKSEFSPSDNAAITAQIIYSFLEGEISFELKLGTATEIFPFKLQEVAQKRSTELIGTKIYSPIIDQAEKAAESELLSKQAGLEKLLHKFTETFTDVLQITCIRFDDDGNMAKTSSGRLEPEVDTEVYNTIVGMINHIISLLDKNSEMRTLDLEDKWVYLHYINEISFLYVIVDALKIFKLIIPLIERISTTIGSLFPVSD